MTAIDYSALWREDVTPDEVVTVYQHLIDTGQAWRMEGHVGRQAQHLIDSGLCMLGDVSHKDYYGNVVPSRHEVEPGTPGSPDYCWEEA